MLKIVMEIPSYIELLYLHSSIGTETVKYLIAKGANVNSKDNNGNTILHKAIQEGNEDIIKFFIDIPSIDFYAQNNKGHTSLYVAAKKAELGIIKILIDKNPNIINVGNDNHNTPLHGAVSKDRLDIVKYLIEKGANVNAKGDNKYTPLHFSARPSNLEMVKYLIAKGADINAKGYDGYTPLHLAVRSSNLEVVKHLMEKGADVYAKNNNGDSILHSAISSSNPNLEIVKYLVEKGADTSAKNNQNKTPLEVAQTECPNCTSIINFLKGKSTSSDVQHTTESINSTTPSNQTQENIQQKSKTSPILRHRDVEENATKFIDTTTSSDFIQEKTTQKSHTLENHDVQHVLTTESVNSATMPQGSTLVLVDNAGYTEAPHYVSQDNMTAPQIDTTTSSDFIQEKTTQKSHTLENHDVQHVLTTESVNSATMPQGSTLVLVDNAGYTETPHYVSQDNMTAPQIDTTTSSDFIQEKTTQKSHTLENHDVQHVLTTESVNSATMPQGSTLVLVDNAGYTETPHYVSQDNMTAPQIDTTTSSDFIQEKTTQKSHTLENHDVQHVLTTESVNSATMPQGSTLVLVDNAGYTEAPHYVSQDNMTAPQIDTTTSSDFIQEKTTQKSHTLENHDVQHVLTTESVNSATMPQGSTLVLVDNAGYTETPHYVSQDNMTAPQIDTTTSSDFIQEKTTQKSHTLENHDVQHVLTTESVNSATMPQGSTLVLVDNAGYTETPHYVSQDNMTAPQIDTTTSSDFIQEKTTQKSHTLENHDVQHVLTTESVNSATMPQGSTLVLVDNAGYTEAPHYVSQDNMTAPQVDFNNTVPVNSTLLLFDMVTRMITGQKHVSSTEATDLSKKQQALSAVSIRNEFKGVMADLNKTLNINSKQNSPNSRLENVSIFGGNVTKNL